MASSISRGGVAPSADPITSRYSPLRSLNHEIDFPSGDQAGFRSATPGVPVRFRQSPFSAGTVKMSPRASITARLPVGDSEALKIRLAIGFHCGSIQGKSPRTVMLTAVALPAFGSNRWIRPPCSNTSTPPPAESDLRS